MFIGEFRQIQRAPSSYPSFLRVVKRSLYEIFFNTTTERVVEE